MPSLQTLSQQRFLTKINKTLQIISLIKNIQLSNFRKEQRYFLLPADKVNSIVNMNTIDYASEAKLLLRMKEIFKNIFIQDIYFFSFVKNTLDCIMLVQNPTSKRV